MEHIKKFKVAKAPENIISEIQNNVVSNLEAKEVTKVNKVINQIGEDLKQKADLESTLEMTNEDISKQKLSESLDEMGLVLKSRLDHLIDVEVTTKYLVEGLIPIDKYGTKGVCISGDGGSGKSIWGENLAHAVSINEPFLSKFKCNNPLSRPVLYIQGEDGVGTNTENIVKQEEIWQTPKSEDRVFNLYGLDSIMDVAKIQKVFDTIKKSTGHYPCLAIVDSLTSFAGLEGIDTWKSTSIIKLQYTFNRIALQYDCVPVWIAHNKKKKDDGQKFLNIAGSYGIGANATQTINLEKRSNEMEDYIYMTITKSNRVSDRDRNVAYQLQIDDNKIVNYVSEEETSESKSKERYTDAYKSFIVAQCNQKLANNNSWEAIAKDLAIVTERMDEKERKNKIESLSKNYKRWKKALDNPNLLNNSKKGDSK
jgi:hypothetical protein